MYRRIVALLCCFLLAGCFHHRHERAQPSGPRQATVTWLGFGCFSVASSIGLTVLTDPFNPSLMPYPVKAGSVSADVVLITHEDENSNFTDLVKGSPIIFRSAMAIGVNRASGIFVRGVRTSSENLVASAHTNVAFVWSTDGIRFCTLGAMEDALTLSESLNLGTVDVLFMPVGGPPSLSNEMRRVTVARLRPHIIIPMLYADRFDSRVPLKPLGNWLSRQPNVVRVPRTFTLTAATLPAVTTVYVPAQP